MIWFALGAFICLAACFVVVAALGASGDPEPWDFPSEPQVIGFILVILLAAAQAWFWMSFGARLAGGA